MKTCVVDTPAKINLAFEITGTLPNGYHEIQTVFQTISLSDRLTLRKIPQGVRLVSTANICPDEENLIVKAAQRFFGLFRKDIGGVEIQLEKRIPVAAGLAGGSANAAGTLIGLGELFHISFPEKQLIDLVKPLGADIPFFFRCGTALGTGTGDVLKPLASLSDLPVLIVIPKLVYFPGEKKTPRVYKLYDEAAAAQPQDEEDRTGKPDWKNVYRALQDRNLPLLGTATANVFEPVVFKKYPQLESIKNFLRESGAPVSLMTGAGPAMVALFATEAERDQVAETLRANGEHQVISATTSAPGSLLVK